MKNFLKVYGAFIAFVLVALSVLFVAFGGVMLSGGEAGSIGEAVGKAILAILGAVFLGMGIIMFIFSILFIISLGKRIKNKSSLVIDSILLLLSVLICVLFVATAISNKDSSILAGLVVDVFLLIYAIPAFISDKKIKKAGKLPEVQEVKEENVEEPKEEKKEEFFYKEIK